MKKNSVILLVLLTLFYISPVYAGSELYSIQLGVFKSEENADKYTDMLNNKGLEAYKVSTSIYAVLYGIYPDKDNAKKDIDIAKKYIKDAYVVKLNKYQHAFVLAKKGINNDIIAKKEEESEDIQEEVVVTTQEDENRKQITIQEISEQELKYTYRVINDIELRGINGESKWFFNIEKGMQVRDFKFNLYLLVNNLIRRDISYYTVYMNNLPIKSMKLNEEDEDLFNKWIIDIPVSTIKEGYNELKIRTHSRITDIPCEDDKNIANWVVVDGKTNYVIKYQRSFSSLNISDFPKPFVGLYDDDALGIAVTIPENYTDNQISSALTLMAHMKDYSYAYAVPSNLITSSDPLLNDYDSYIYIGDFASIPDSIKHIIGNKENINTDYAHIYSSYLDKKKKPILMILSNDDDRLIDAVKSLKNNDIKDQMTANHIMLKPDLEIQIKEEKIDDDYIYLEELGLKGIEIKGSNQQVTSIGLRIPSNQVLANESSINLKLRYSDNLDFEKSIVSVYVNGVPIGSQKLEKDKRDLHLITFYMPASLRKNNYYDVRIVFELIPAGIINCERYLSSVPWAYIEGDSNYFFPTLERELMLFESLPFPFARNEDLEMTTIVMPEKINREDLKIAGKVAELSGIGVKKNQGIINAISASKFSAEYYDNNLVIFGTPYENKLIKKLNENLWFNYNEEFTRVLSNEKIELLPETSTTATFLELKESPYSDNKGMLTLTSINKDSLIKSTVYLEDNKRGYLTGDGAIISKDGDIKTFRFQKEENERPLIETGEIMSKSSRDYILFTAAIVLFLIIALSFYAIRNRRNNR